MKKTIETRLREAGILASTDVIALSVKSEPVYRIGWFIYGTKYRKNNRK